MVTIRAFLKDSIPYINGKYTFKYKDTFLNVNNKILELEVENLLQIPNVLDLQQFRKIIHQNKIIHENII